MTKKIRIVLSSPGDVVAEQQALKQAVEELNRSVAQDRDLVLEICHWKTHARPGIHPDGPQGVIDPLLDIPRSDIFVGIFWKHFGTPTKTALSGTEDEYLTALKSLEDTGKPEIMMFFKLARFEEDPSIEELMQYTRVKQFREELVRQKVLSWVAEDTEAFKDAVRNSLLNYIREKFPLLKAGQDGSSYQPSSIEDEVIHDFCRKMQQDFASIYLFGAKRRAGQGETKALKRMSSMDQGFVPLHLRDWRDDGGDGALLDIDAVFLADKVDPPRFLVRGLPGSGKTTLLRYLAHRMATLSLEGSGEWIPVYVRLREFDCRKATLEEWVRQEVKMLSGDAKVCRALCTEDRFLERPMALLLDGLDEIEDEGTRGKIAGLLGDLARKFPFCLILVTSRPIELNRWDYPKYRPLDLQPLNEEMIDDYLARWFGDAIDKIARLHKTIMEKPRINSLATTPFLLSMICYTYEEGGETELIERRSQLYEKCTSRLLKRAYDPESQSGKPIDFKATRKLLKEIALRFFLWQEADFDVAHVNVMGRRLPEVEALGKSDDVLRRVARDTGLIQQGQEGFTFVHRSLWEYFTALALLDKKDPKFVIRQAANPEWEEVVRLYAGLLQDPECEQDLVNRLWTINRPLALRVTTETRTTAAELLAPLIAGETDNKGKLLLINSLQQSLDLVLELERPNLVEETLRILLIECQEADCEVIFHAQALMEKEGLHPLDGARRGLIYELLDLEQASVRQKGLLNDPANHFEWIEIDGGTFQMGDDQHGADEKPVHPVQVDTFLMAKHPVTNRLLKSFPLGQKYSNYGGESHPAVGNTWFEAYYFALWVGARLPSEAEWEYAARGGRKARPGQYFFGNEPGDLADHAWFGESGRNTANEVDAINPRTGKEHLNPLLLANMLGNTWEWVEDDWHGNYEDAPPDSLPWTETPRGTNRVLRGGSWFNDANYCRSAKRARFTPDFRNTIIGFRLARSIVLGS